MESLLGVPIRPRNEVFGDLYLVNHVGGAFSAEDEELLRALAATAGVAVENPRLYEVSRQILMVRGYSASSLQPATRL
jgi:GAF domain-containing protein